jgi:hypothetical protein
MLAAREPAEVGVSAMILPLPGLDRLPWRQEAYTMVWMATGPSITGGTAWLPMPEQEPIVCGALLATIGAAGTPWQAEPEIAPKIDS